MARTALITGGSGAIGSAICRTLAREAGYRVIIHGSGENDRADLLADEINQQGGEARAVYFDITDETATRAGCEGLLQEGPVQIIVANAGGHDDAPFAGMDGAKWRRVIDLNLNGFYNVVQPLLLEMMRTRWGRIIAITSVAGIVGNRGQSNYAAAKAGVHGAVRSLALECASRGLTVNAVAPGIIATPDSAKLFPAEKIAQLVPMKRMGECEEVADLVAFLASEKSAYITGQTISLNGGMV